MFAHFAASPGTEVSILWGLVRYTKSPDNHLESSSLKSEKSYLQDVKNNNSQKKDTSFLPLSLFTKYNLAKSDIGQFIISYRKENNIREIQTLESGKPARLLSDGFYSFIFSFAISSETVFGFNIDFKELLLNMRTQRYRSSENEFEIHFINKEKIMLLGFVNKKDASDISFLSGKNSHSVILSPLYFSDFTTFVAIPIDRIIYSNDRSIEVSKKEWYHVLEVNVK